ncbi:Dicer-like protein 1 [Mortierella sp. GBA30]|nr:Dicer-like protein 1 [Mortierella sp. GBA30]
MTQYKSDAPRSYQIAVAERAMRENIIAVSDTGTGKTLISVILLKSVVAQARQEAERTGQQKKIAFFVVNKVPLVFQQLAYITSNSDIEATAIYGAMGVDGYTEKKWHEIFSENEVIVLTGQILCNVLLHGYLKMHNLMTEYYNEAHPSDRPKIFGMTASPAKDKHAISFSAVELEYTLHARIVTAPYDEVLAFTNRPKESVVIYDNLPNCNPAISYHSKTIITLQDLCSQDKRLNSVLKTYEYALNELGPWCATAIWKYAFQDLKTDIEETTGLNRERRLQMIKAAESVIANMEIPELDEALSSCSDKVKKMIEILRETSAKDGFCAILFVERRPAAHVLRDLLERYQRFGPKLGLESIRPATLTGHGTKGDVVRHRMEHKDQRRILAGFRKGTFNLLVSTDVAEEGLDIDRCRLVVRFDVKTSLISHIQSRGRARDANSEYIIMQQRDHPNHLQIVTRKENEMRNWCNGLPNEQRIQLRNHNAFDDDDDDDGLGQMKELAKVQTTYYVESTGARVTFASAVALLHQYCASLPADSYTQLKPEFEIHSDIQPGKWVCLVTLPPNAPFFDRISDPFSKQGLAKRAVAFQACKELHQLGALTDRMLPHPRKVRIKDDLGETEDLALVDGNGNQSSLQDYPIQQPQFWSSRIVVPTPPPSAFDSEEFTTANVAKSIPLPLALDSRESTTVQLYMAIFTLRVPPTDSSAEATQEARINHRRIGLLTKESLPEFDPFELFFNGDSRWVDMSVINQPIELTAEQIRNLHQYHELLFSIVFRKPVNVGSVDTGIRHIIAPLNLNLDLTIANGVTPDQWIDWAEIESGAANTIKGTELEPTNLTWETVQDMVLFEKAETGRLYYVTALRADLSPASPIPALISGTREAGQEEDITFAEFYKIKQDRHIQDLTQPLIEVERMPRSTNLLQPMRKQARKAQTSNARFLIPELCLLSAVSASALRSAFWMISVLDRIDGLLKAKEFMQEFNLGSISPTWMLEALTASDAAYAMNYQRLELLGDTFLKFMMAVDVYIRYPELDEGRLTAKRTLRISNSYLFKRAHHLKLDRFLIRLAPSNAHFFVVNSNEIESEQQDQDQDQQTPLKNNRSGVATDQNSQPRPLVQSQQDRWEISNKTMADLIESTLGAAFLTDGFHLGFAAANALLGPLKDIHCWDDFAKSYVRPASWDHGEPLKPAEGLGDLRKVERAIGYTFRQKRLLAEALTHATFPRPQTPCYQRLEFLGDSVLDMLVADYWVRKYPVSGPGKLHLIKSASTNFQILGVLCIQLGLHKHILHASPTLGNDINRTVQALEDAQDEAVTSAAGELVGEYWDEFEFSKVLSDVLESVLAAIYIDSGWDYSVVQAFFARAILPTLQKHLKIETLKPHPVTALLHRIQGAGCQELKLRNVATLDLSTLQSPSSTVIEPLTEAHVNVRMQSLPPPGSREQGSSSRSLWEEAASPPRPIYAVLIHGQIAATATDSQIQAARKKVAKMALKRFDDDSNWLDLYCNCATREIKRARESSLETPSSALVPPLLS